jgi:hypothetical protein
MTHQYARFYTFGVVYGVVYLAFFFANEFYQYSLFGYYPVLASFSTTRLPLQEAGPAILWYSWLFAALVVSLVITAIVPKSLAARLGRTAIWVVPTALLILILVYERRWFY